MTEDMLCGLYRCYDRGFVVVQVISDGSGVARCGGCTDGTTKGTLL